MSLKIVSGIIGGAKSPDFGLIEEAPRIDTVEPPVDRIPQARRVLLR